MAKRQCDPTSGSIGNQTYLQGRNGQVVRTRAVPANPRTPAQMNVRAILSATARAWRELTDQQRAAWTAMALDVQSKPRLGQSGTLTGEQLYCQLNIALQTYGQAPVSDPPAFPTFPALAPANLVIANVGGVISLKLTCPADPGENTIVRASPPVSAGVMRPPRVVVIGTCPAPVLGASDITALYTARYGLPSVESRVFVAVNQFVDGWEDPLTYFNDVVPASS